MLIITAFIFDICFAQKDTLQILQQNLASAITDSSKENALVDLHNAYFKSNPAKSYYYANEILKFGLKLNSPQYISRGYRAIARCIRKKRDYTSIFKYDSLALKYAVLYGDSDLINSQQILFVHDYLDAGQLEEAFEWLEIANPIVLKLNKPAVTAEWNYSLAYYYSETNQNSKAIIYFNNARQIFKQLNDTKNVAETNIFLAQTLQTEGKTDSVANLLIEALNIYKKINSEYRMGTVNELLGDILCKKGNFTEAIQYYLNAQKLFSLHNNSIDAALCMIYLARAYMLKKEYTTAKSYIIKAKATFDTMNYDNGKIKIQTLLGQFYSETGNPQTAEQYFINASNMLKNKNLPDIKTENDKYENENAILSVAIIQKQKIIISLIILITILLGAALYLQYKSRQRAQRDTVKIQLLQNEIHHRIKNNFSTLNRFIEMAQLPGEENLLLASLQNRITAMQLLHKNLYLSSQTGNILLQTYLEQLVQFIQSTYSTKNKNIKTYINAPAFANMLLAEKIGLLINELLTNSFKYGFVNKDKGEISILTQEISNKQFKLLYNENGIGYNKNEIVKGYGSKLIEGLAKEIATDFVLETTNRINFSIIILHT